MTVSAQSRIKVLDNPNLAPGTCIVCGSAGDGERKFIDFGKQVDWIGAIYFCTFCVVEIVEAGGYIPVATFDKLHDEYRDLQVKNDQLVAKYQPFEEAINHVVESRTSMPHLDFDNLRSRISEPESTESDITIDEGSSDTEPDAIESGNIEGSDDLFDSTDFDDQA